MLELPSHLRIVNNQLSIGDVFCTDIAEDFGTPTYVYDLERVVENYRKLRDGLTQHSDKDVIVYYAVKANFNSEILKALSKEGAHADVLYVYEAGFALCYGFPKYRIMFTGTRARAVVSGYSLAYRIQWIDGLPDWEVEDYYVVFYSPMDNLTLRMYPFVYYPPEGVNLPLTIQKGIALLNESGVPVQEEHYNITFWQSPIIWSVNASSGRAYDALLLSKGWYTFCLTGPISRHGDEGILLGMFGVRIDNGTQGKFEAESAWVNIKLLRNEEPVLFIVDLAHEW